MVAFFSYTENRLCHSEEVIIPEVSAMEFGFVICVLFIVAIGYWMHVCIVMGTWLSGNALFMHVLFFSIITGIILWNYFSCAMTDPGRVPKNYVPDFRLGVDLKSCRKCNEYKPPRAHHCSSLGRCVPRMDHYCVWVQNCVGHRNYKYFYLFLFYISVGYTHIWIMLGWRITSIIRETGPSFTPVQTIVVVLSCLLEVPTSLMLYGFFGFHTYLTATNQTSIEHFENDRHRYIAERQNRPFRHLYDIGIVNNFRSVMGSNWYMWLVPSVVDGDGVHFSMCADLEKYWPNIYENQKKLLNLDFEDPESQELARCLLMPEYADAKAAALHPSVVNNSLSNRSVSQYPTHTSHGSISSPSLSSSIAELKTLDRANTPPSFKLQTPESFSSPSQISVLNDDSRSLYSSSVENEYVTSCSGVEHRQPVHVWNGSASDSEQVSGLITSSNSL